MEKSSIETEKFQKINYKSRAFDQFGRNEIIMN